MCIRMQTLMWCAHVVLIRFGCGRSFVCWIFQPKHPRELGTHNHRCVDKSTAWRNTAIWPTTEHAQKTPDFDHEPNRRTIVLLKTMTSSQFHSADAEASRRWRQTTAACSDTTGPSRTGSQRHFTRLFLCCRSAVY